MQIPVPHSRLTDSGAAQLLSLGIMKRPGICELFPAGDGCKEGGLSVEPGWFQLWPPAEIERWNREYQVAEFAPEFLGFGSSGGGELLAFDAGGRVVSDSVYRHVR